MDGIGINKDLDPVEAATLLRIDPKRVLTMIMFDMMKKGNVKLISTDPIRLELVSRQDLNYYEKLYADAIKDNALDEDALLNCFKVLARRVVDKTRPYSRKDTELYYKQKIDEAWAAIQAVDTPELKLQKYDTNMIWLMADEQFKQKTSDYVAKAPGSSTVIVPPTYWWYPYYFGMPHYYGGTGMPQQTGAPYADERAVHGRQAHEHDHGQRGDLRELHLQFGGGDVRRSGRKRREVRGRAESGERAPGSGERTCVQE